MFQKYNPSAAAKTRRILTLVNLAAGIILESKSNTNLIWYDHIYIYSNNLSSYGEGKECETIWMIVSWPKEGGWKK